MCTHETSEIASPAIVEEIYDPITWWFDSRTPDGLLVFTLSVLHSVLDHSLCSGTAFALTDPRSPCAEEQGMQ